MLQTKQNSAKLLAARFPIAMEGILVLFILHRTDLPAGVGSQVRLLNNR